MIINYIYSITNMATIERSIEEMIEEAEGTGETEQPPTTNTPIQKKPKKPRSQKQIESLAKARQARADKLAKNKVQAPSNNEGNNVPRSAAREKKKQRKIVIENEDGTSSEEEIIVIKNKSKKKKRKQPRVVYQQESSSSEEEEEEYYPKTNYASYRFL